MARRFGSVSLIAAAVLSILTTAAAADEKPEQAPVETTARPAIKRLDLRPPDITRLYTSQQIQLMLAKTYADNIEGVEVEGAREPPPPDTPTVWGGIAAPFWAILHPTQAWRIFAPLPPDQTRRMRNDAPDATKTFIEPAAPTFP